MEYCDQLLRTVNIPEYPSRIISLVPSITELLADLSLESEISGITKFCIHPQQIFKSKPRIGGTKNINIEKVFNLNPDLIIANKEENNQSDIQLLEADFPVWVSNVNSFIDAVSMIRSIGSITGKAIQANEIIEQITENFNSIEPVSSKSVLYLIWKQPYMAAGKGTFIDDLLNKCGFQNVLSDLSRYPLISSELTTSLKPDVVILSSEPYPFKQKDIADIQSMFPTSLIILADGEYFSWYGSRMIHAPKYFNKLNSYITETLLST